MNKRTVVEINIVKVDNISEIVLIDCQYLFTEIYHSFGMKCRLQLNLNISRSTNGD